MTSERKKLPLFFQTAALFLIVAGLPLSVFLMSLGLACLLLAFVTEENLAGRISALKKNPVFLSFAGLYLLHIIGLLYTTDFKFGLNDIKVKLPLIIFPAVFISLPKPPARIIRYTTLLFLLSILTATVHAFLVYHQIIPVKKDISDVRNITVFVSHIRIALMICVAIYILVYDAFFRGLINKIIALLLFGWCIYFLYLLESGTGLFILLVTGFTVLVVILFTFTRPLIRILTLIAICSVLGFVFIFSKSAINDYFTPKESLTNLENYTEQGNLYHHDFNYLTLENGYYVGIYQCRQEMIPAWNSRSTISFDSLDKKGQRLGFTLIRYLTSKGLRKDAKGVNSLTETDIRNVENGIANINYTQKSGMQKRFEQLLFEFDNYFVTDNAGGNSVTQRIEYWKTGWRIFKAHPFTGVGTGDSQLAFNTQYKDQKTNLPQEYWHRSHNQYLAFMVTFGVGGFIVFLISLLIPLIKAWNEWNVLYMLFFICASLSFLIEDTLETQAGVTFFMFFTCFFLYYEGNNYKPEES